MEPALTMITRALQGDSGAQSFLERTTSIYVLDVTDNANPKTYGCWNFIHQAMNEIERQEAQVHIQQTNSHLVAHARLLASMGLRVARRSPLADRNLVATCLANASHYAGSDSQSQWLLVLNSELREKVMARIAAMAFDFSFHRRTGPHGKSAFADRSVMDSFCAILSANAVASGPSAIRLFATEWIIPSSRNLPPFAVASVVSHLAEEGMRKPAQAGTKDCLQQLSVPAVAIVLVPTLTEAISESNVGENGEKEKHEEEAHIAAMCLRALKMWCDATDLSLPQIKHICSKINVNIVEILSDAMYSDSQHVIERLAELIESTVLMSDEKVMSPGRMNQVRHILQVDEVSFQAQFTAQQLKSIESHEMSSIVDELVSAVALQRFRFVERQNRGDNDVCRNLARICTSVCGTCLDIAATQSQSVRYPDGGAINLLVKTSAHPHVNISAIALPCLIRLVPLVPSLAHEVLPALQRRAIIPHHTIDNGFDLDAPDICGVNLYDFQVFRDQVLGEALVVCWKQGGDHYMDSCTSAVEEFCLTSSSEHVSLQLEAALFCVEVIADEIYASLNVFPHDSQLKRLLDALSSKPKSLMANHVTRETMCRFLKKYSRWCASNGALGAAADLAMASFIKGKSLEPPFVVLVGNSYEAKLHSDASEASVALKIILNRDPKYFASDASLGVLSSLWETTYVAVKRGSPMNIGDRICLATGICRVLSILPEGQRIELFKAFVSPTLDWLTSLTQIIQIDKQALQKDALFAQIGDEIHLLSSMTKHYSASITKDMPIDDSQIEFIDRAQIPRPVLEIIHRAWPSIIYVASHFVDNERLTTGLKAFFSSLLPPIVGDATDVALLRELCSIASSIIQVSKPSTASLDVIFDFIDLFIESFGNYVESATIKATNTDVGRLLEDIVTQTVDSVHDYLGNAWSTPSEQENGQAASESRQTPKQRQKPTDCLAWVLSMLELGLRHCPIFFMRITSSNDANDQILYLATIAATASLQDEKPEVIRSSVLFLKTLVGCRSSLNPEMQAFVNQLLLRVRADVIHHLILGADGKYEYSILPDVAALMSMLLSGVAVSEAEPQLVSSLDHHFLLGDAAKNLVLSVLLRHCEVSMDPMDLSNLTNFLQEVWRLHQVEDAEALPGSDEVARFIQRFQ